MGHEILLDDGSKAKIACDKTILSQVIYTLIEESCDRFRTAAANDPVMLEYQNLPHELFKRSLSGNRAHFNLVGTTLLRPLIEATEVCRRASRIAA